MQRRFLVAGAALVVALTARPRPADAQRVPELSATAQAQIDSLRRAVAKYADPNAAEDAGYQPVFGLVPLQGVHYVKPELIENGRFELDEPPVLMYAPVKGTPTLVGVAYAYEHPRADPPPEGFDGPNDDWHSHDELSRDPDSHIVMVHVWLTDTPGGPFARYNTWLPYMAASLRKPSAAELTAPTARGERARRFAFALAIATHPVQIFDLLESRGGEQLSRVAYPHRRALMSVVDSLRTAEQRGDRASYDRLATTMLAHSDSLMTAYRGMGKSPQAREFLNRALDELMGIGHEGHHAMPGTTPAAGKKGQRGQPANKGAHVHPPPG